MSDLSAPSTGLLAAGDPHPVSASNPGGASPLLLVGDHAGRGIPAALGALGLPPAELDRHSACDIGVAGLGEKLATALDAVFIRQRYSRLVIDCNRVPGAEGSIAEVSDGARVPANLGLTADQAEVRRREIYQPYHNRIAAELDARAAAGRATILFALHSFTPVMDGLDRPWRFGVLHRGDSPFSSAVLARLQADLGEAAGDNQPYSLSEVDNTVPLHADTRGLDYLELEVRQDLIATAQGQAEVAGYLAAVLREALARVPTPARKGSA